MQYSLCNAHNAKNKRTKWSLATFLLRDYLSIYHKSIYNQSHHLRH